MGGIFLWDTILAPPVIEGTIGLDWISEIEHWTSDTRVDGHGFERKANVYRARTRRCSPQHHAQRAKGCNYKIWKGTGRGFSTRRGSFTRRTKKERKKEKETFRSHKIGRLRCSRGRGLLFGHRVSFLFFPFLFIIIIAFFLIGILVGVGTYIGSDWTGLNWVGHGLGIVGVDVGWGLRMGMGMGMDSLALFFFSLWAPVGGFGCGYGHYGSLGCLSDVVITSFFPPSTVFLLPFLFPLSWRKAWDIGGGGGEERSWSGMGEGRPCISLSEDASGHRCIPGGRCWGWALFPLFPKETLVVSALSTLRPQETACRKQPPQPQPPTPC